MRSFVTAGLSQDVSGFGLRIRAGGRTYGLMARIGTAGPGEDEHFAVDVDRCGESRWRDCADVLYSRHPGSPPAAVRRAAEILAAHPACRVAAAAVRGGGWAVTDGTAALLIRQQPPHQPLLVSCLHAWLAAGHSLDSVERVFTLP
ncbi:hypothetical protein [Streptomyces acidiscabies]|uniref:hypothetical protein n=1 Tax=Streptomyces acidiscabies TaxID=42234 RepID=UPI00067C9CD6|nr:hypothetical protein [Streptomyces acidiscabies]